MIIPTPDYDPLFANDGVSFRTKMIDYIRHEFADILGVQAVLLDRADGLDALSQIHVHCADKPINRDAA